MTKRDAICHLMNMYSKNKAGFAIVGICRVGWLTNKSIHGQLLGNKNNPRRTSAICCYLVEIGILKEAKTIGNRKSYKTEAVFAEAYEWVLNNFVLGEV